MVADMGNSDEAWKAERLARALRQMEALKMYNCPADFDESMHLTWTRGSATGGYKELSDAMSAIVAARWSELRDAAIAACQKSIDDVREELRASLQGAEK
jgi:hypothetical protein